MKHVRRILLPALPIALVAALWLGCGGDDGAGPGGGGGGGGNATVMTLPAGVYDLSLKVWPCGVPDTTTLAIVDTMCSPGVADELPFPLGGSDYGLPCPIMQDGNTLSVSCTPTVMIDVDCTITLSVQMSGTVSNDVWLLSGTINVTNQSPADCFSAVDCVGYELRAERLSPPPGPPVCQSTMSLSIAGGPFAGMREFGVDGVSYAVGGQITASVSAFYPVPVLSPGQSAGYSESILLSFTTPAIDPATLPQTFPVQASGLQNSSRAGGQAVVYMTYSEYRASPLYVFNGDNGTGTMTISEISETRVSGTFNNVGISGTELPAKTPGSRTLNGSFSSGLFPSTATPAGAVARDQ